MALGRRAPVRLTSAPSASIRWSPSWPLCVSGVSSSTQSWTQKPPLSSGSGSPTSRRSSPGSTLCPRTTGLSTSSHFATTTGT
ncbi:unnamed protein product [Symbiodinium natans]|uniref:Uncharacterized protein n=1 Tax=Symbiodinium natans TaxID=878477 RepID=A0A812UWG3_9DINO|nr:unnamed protein product [Symbiodinium natans]